MYNPEEDGITHINVYSKGKTWLGRRLSNFDWSPVDLEDGKFHSIEGYWYWLSSDHEDKDDLRHLYGYAAKMRGRELRGKDWIETEEFKEKIKRAITVKINQHFHIQKKLVESTLPFTHYYVFGDRVVLVEKGKWILEHLEQLRTSLK